MKNKYQSAYAEKLKDPRWQKKRLEVFDRDKFTCQICLETENTLAVHHLDYQTGLEPWEYDSSWLLTVCEECHTIESNDRKLFEKEVINLLRLKKFFALDMFHLSTALKHFDIGRKPRMTERASSLVSWILYTPEVFDKIEAEFISKYGDMGWDDVDEVTGQQQ